MTEPCELSARQARALIESKALSPVELLDSCIARIERINPALNAMVTTSFERARVEARAAERQVMQGLQLGILHGLPIAVKDSHATEGIRTTMGSPHFKDQVPDEDEHAVAAIRDAGGIVIGKTNIPEMSIGGNTVNRLFGATGNPFDPSLTCGGSSGGSAVALAAGMAPLATGSDTGGSLRLPASFCGVVAHRPSAGVVAHPKRTMAQTYYGMQGPMARSASDASLLLAAMAKRNSRDPMSYPLDPAQFIDVERVDLAGLKVAVTPDLGGVPVSATIRRTFESKVRAFGPLFGACEWHDPKLGEAMDVFWKLRSIVFIAQYSREIAGWDADFNPNIRSNCEAALRMGIKEVAEAHRMQMDLYQRVQDVLAQFDVIVCPCVSIPPFPWRDLFPRQIDGMPSETYVGWVGMTSALTVVGNPITTIPCGLDEGRMPFGIQVVGQNFQDKRTLAVASAMQDAFAGIDGLRQPRPDFARLNEPLQAFA
ncbi:MAG: amidase [Pseudomonadota bacterium]